MCIFGWSSAALVCAHGGGNPGTSCDNIAHSEEEYIHPSPQSEIDESALHFAEVWTLFARRARSGEVSRQAGLTLACSHVTWPILNSAFLIDAVADADDLRHRLQSAEQFFAARHLGWMFFPCESWMPDPLRGSVPQICAEFGLQRIMNMVGMVASGPTQPLRPLPSLEFRTTPREPVRIALAEVNAAAYQLPREIALEPINVEDLWADDAVGFVGYAEGQPVTSACVVVNRNVLYVALVATRPDCRNQGYAETAIRFGLEAMRKRTALQRTILHATPAGLKLYEQMGYRAVANFPAYLTLAH